MYPRWLKTFAKPLEWLGRLRPAPPWRRRDRALVVGSPQWTTDALGGNRWRDYGSPQRLFDAWGPDADSPWWPYHCATLFAAVDRIPKDQLHPAPPASIPEWLQADLAVPAWWDRRTFLIVDAQGSTSLAVAAPLVANGLMQPVCTFDNWPHPQGLIRPEKVLAALLRYASMVDARPHPFPPDTPPIWICDVARLGSRGGFSEEFDNRYFLDDSILPGPSLLVQARLQRVVYAGEQPDQPPAADLREYLQSLGKAGLELLQVGLADAAQWEAQPHPLILPTDKTGQIRFRRQGYLRSTAGGFGQLIPSASSSSSG